MTSSAERLEQALRGERQARPSYGFWEASFRRLLRDRYAMFALIGLAFLIVLSFSAPIWEAARGTPRDAIDLFNDYQRPNAQNWLGTDEFGRDVFIRLLYGGQNSMVTGFAVAAIIMLIGVPFGLVAGYFGGIIDDAFNWVVQTLANIPTFPALILLSSLIRPSPLVLAVLIGALGWLGNARQARGLAIQLRQREYVTAARAMGASNFRIIFSHIFPNIVSLMIILAGFDVVGGVLAESTLSLFGLGIRPPDPSWGNMLTNSLGYAFRGPYLIFPPGITISLFAYFVYTLADGLRDAFDPNLNE